MAQSLSVSFCLKMESIISRCFYSNLSELTNLSEGLEYVDVSIEVYSTIDLVFEAINSSVLSLVIDDESFEVELSLDSVSGSYSFSKNLGKISLIHVLIGFLLFYRGIGSSLFIHAQIIYFFISSSASI